MNAQVLRKWSLAKNLMFLLLPVLITLVFWCQFTTALAPSSVLSLSHNDITNHGFHHKHRRHARHLINRYANTDNRNISNDNIQIIINPINSNGDHVNTKISNMLKALYDKNAKKSTVTATTATTATATASSTNFNKLIERSNANKQNVPSVPNLNKISQKFTHNIHTDDDDDDEDDDNDNHDDSKMGNEIKNIIIAVSPKNCDANQTQNDEISSIEAANEQLLTDSKNSSQNRTLLQYRMKRLRNELYRRNVQRQPMNAFNNNKQQQSHQIGRSRRVSRSNMNRYSNIHSFSKGHSNDLIFNGISLPKQRRFCSARDPTTLAFEAPTVFEGKVRSMSSDRRRNFSVTFEVKEIFKRQNGLKIPSLIRLKFTYRNSSECDIYREEFRSVGYVRDELEPGKLYILFVNQIGLGNFTILGQPIKRTRKTVNDVRTGVKEDYGQRAYIESIAANNATIREGKRIRIVCKVRGQPPPKVTWFKDEKSIARNRSKYQFVHLRRRSELIIKSALVNDSGQYECRAKNKVAKQPDRRITRIEVLPKIHEHNFSKSRHPYQPINSGSSCPVIGNAFCLNGGTCLFFKDVGEPACKCPDGFLGNRCETKNPTNIHSSTYRNNQDIHQCGDNNFYGSYYC